MARLRVITLLRRAARRTPVVAAALALVGTPAGAAAQQVNACYVPSVGAVYLIGLTGLPTACLASGHVPVTLGGGALADGSVTAVKLADGAVITLKLADGAVTAAKLAPGAVGTAQLADGAVTSAKLGADVVLGIPDGSINTAKLADGAVTAPKLAFDPATQAELDALSAPGAINTIGNPVDWTKLKGVPAGFADGVDENSGGTVTSIATAAGLLGGPITSSGTVSVNFAGPGAATTVARSDHTHAAAGTNNTAVGSDALKANIIGFSNTAVGLNALGANTTGDANTAVGVAALAANTGGGDNIAVGRNALGSISTGSNNIGVGSLGGFNVTTGSNNIHIGATGSTPDNGVIRIGGFPIAQTQTFIAGISGATSAAGAAVFVSTSGQLGTLTSSARFKEGVADLGETSRRVLRLRPVQFRYKPEYDDGSRLTQYGLIAEEVAEVFPELVLYGPSGEVETVRYHLLAPLLLNELQRQERELVALLQVVEELRAELCSKR